MKCHREDKLQYIVKYERSDTQNAETRTIENDADAIVDCERRVLNS